MAEWFLKKGKRSDIVKNNIILYAYNIYDNIIYMYLKIHLSFQKQVDWVLIRLGIPISSLNILLLTVK